MVFFEKDKGYGNYGLKFRYKLFGVSIFSVFRDRIHDSIYLLGVTIYKRKHINNHSNAKVKEKNMTLAHSVALNKNSKKILFIVDNLQEVGGVESRLAKLCIFLRKNNLEPCFLSNYNRNRELLEYPNFYLDFKAPDAVDCLFDLLKKLNFNVIEFQFKSAKFFSDIDLDNLKKTSIVGCCIHEEMRIKQAAIDSLDYVLSSAVRKSFMNYKLIPNWSTEVGFRWKYTGQKKAIFISRISKDKLLSIINFIKFCKKNAIDFEIAGYLDFKNNAKIIDKIIAFGVPRESLIGSIVTEKFLMENVNNYFMVGGVGQVAIEASNMGYPTIVSPSIENDELATFLTKDNIGYLYENNFVIRNEENFPFLGNADEFFNAKNNGDFSEYDVSDEIQKQCGESKVLSEYLDIIEPVDTSLVSDIN